jgi:hypothetical protein
MHEGAVAKAISVFNDSAVGSGSARLKYEKLLQSFFKKSFEVTEELELSAFFYCQRQ